VAPSAEPVRRSPLRRAPAESIHQKAEHPERLCGSRPQTGSKGNVNVRNRVALITGANKGIGLQIAKDLASHGLTVLIGSRKYENGEAAAKTIGEKAHAIQLDVTDQGLRRYSSYASHSAAYARVSCRTDRQYGQFRGLTHSERRTRCSLPQYLWRCL